MQTWLLTFKHLKSLHGVNAALGQLLCLQLEESCGLGVSIKCMILVIGHALEHEAFFVNLAHHLLMILNLVQVDSLELPGLRSDCSQELALLGQLETGLLVVK